MTYTKSGGTIWDDIARDPAEALQLKTKAALFDSIRAYIAENQLSQKEAAERMGAEQSRIGDIKRAKFDEFTIDHLVHMADRVGVNPLTMRGEQLSLIHI